MRGYCRQDEGIDIVLPAGFDEYSSESVRHFRVESIWIDRAKCPYIIFCGAARDLQSQSKRQYSPSSHAPPPLPHLRSLASFFFLGVEDLKALKEMLLRLSKKLGHRLKGRVVSTTRKVLQGLKL